MAIDHIAKPHRTIFYVLPALLAALVGCGQTRTRLGTDQLLLSDAVDKTVSQIDFSPLSGQKVHFEEKYVRAVKGLLFVNAEYVISSLRQQMVAAGCLLQDDAKGADYIVEARLGALGTDGHEVTYGIPPSTGLSTAASLLPNAPPIPMIPEISVARKNDYRGAAKIALFAYHRETRQPVWQSGVTVAASDAKEAWLFGAGPIQYGSIYDGTRFAGARLRSLFWRRRVNRDKSKGEVSYYDHVDFAQVAKKAEERKAMAEALDEQVVETPELSPLSQEVLAAPEPSQTQHEIADPGLPAPPDAEGPSLDN
jgi:hypothetical protein